MVIFGLKRRFQGFWVCLLSEQTHLAELGSKPVKTKLICLGSTMGKHTEIVRKDGLTDCNAKMFPALVQATV